METQTKAEVGLTIDQLLVDEEFIKGDIEVVSHSSNSSFSCLGLYYQVGGQIIHDVPFANRALRSFAQHVLFHQLNLQQYISSDRNLGALLAFIGTLFDWALRELKTGVFLPSDFDLSAARKALDKKLHQYYTSMASNVRDALVASIFTLAPPREQ